jgi:hypothetical protein
MEQRTGLVDTSGQCTEYRYKIPVTGAHNCLPCQPYSLDRIMGENPLKATGV